MKQAKINWRVNQQITADKVRIIGPDGKQIGVMKLKNALQESIDKDLDLVEIAPNADPPVVKIVDLGKFKYQEEKKLKKAKKGAKSSEIKEIRFSPFIGEQDYLTRLERINGFLNEGHKIRAVVKFKGRQMNSKKFGYDLLDKLFSEVDSEINVDMKPKFLGRHLTTVISPVKKSVKKENINDKSKKEQTKDKKDNNKKVQDNQKRKSAAKKSV